MAAPVVWTRTRVMAVLALTAGMALTACTGDVQGMPTNVPVASNPPLGPFPSDVAGRLRTEPDILYTETTDCGGSPCRVPGDVIAPAEGRRPADRRPAGRRGHTDPAAAPDVVDLILEALSSI